MKAAIEIIADRNSWSRERELLKYRNLFQEVTCTEQNAAAHPEQTGSTRFVFWPDYF